MIIVLPNAVEENKTEAWTCRRKVSNLHSQRHQVYRLASVPIRDRRLTPTTT